MMNLISWIVVGLLGGAIAKAIMPGTQGGGWIATILLGIVGAFVGGLVGDLIFHGDVNFGRPNFSFQGILSSIVGALIILAVWGWLASRNGTGSNTAAR